MSAVASTHSGRASIMGFVRVMLAASRVQRQIWASNLILLIRRPLTPTLVFLSMWLAYDISGQQAVPKDQVTGFLIVGIMATQAWQATVWSCGFGLQMDAYNGTLPSILASPGNRLAVVLGYGLGDIVLSMSAVLTTLLVGLALGASFDVANPLLAVVAMVLMYASALSIGACLSGVFILSRNANPLANFLQTPIYILAGFYFPRSVLPDWLEPVGAVLPVTHALEALRATLLEGAGWSDVTRPFALAMGLSVAFLIAGVWSLGRVDHELRRSGTLNLF